ncbi:hypothetical protein JRO89_XS14G0062400 [Xanthoceras sorbifolium]|uniref:Uncharacterized protein n=1 Tax=Xanthoceras sorbifolium TaxID=99658 RepID=A0ABQ8H415_9ROSI|nr:hypothetical protein JRO89_XS14G0062400 [Xanthoceras sorbifolium]
MLVVLQLQKRLPRSAFLFLFLFFCSFLTDPDSQSIVTALAFSHLIETKRSHSGVDIALDSESKGRGFDPHCDRYSVTFWKPFIELCGVEPLGSVIILERVYVTYEGDSEAFPGYKAAIHDLEIAVRMMLDTNRIGVNLVTEVMIDDQDLGFFANFLGIFIFIMVIAYHFVMADPKYEGN